MNEERNNVLTASRMGCAMKCLRQHYYQCEVGLQKLEVGLALRIGSAWARAMEARWKRATYEGALASALPDGIELDAFSLSTVAALLAGYYDYYGKRENLAKIHPEVQFAYDLGEGFTVEGKMDGLGSLKDGRSVLIEDKTTRESLDPASDYWLRLSFNMQLFQYVLAAREHGWDVSVVLYDVTRKPSIRPRKEVGDLDSEGRKIVVDSEGKRVFNLAGKNKGEPRQSADAAKGYFIKCHKETPDEFCDRLWIDTRTRPEFYFQRREVPILDGDLEAFESQRLAIARLILSLRANEKGLRNPADAWPRNVSKDTCNYCSFKSFCLQNISLDVNNPPQGFVVRPFNPELQLEQEHDTDETGDNSPEASC
jgi:hypothetical protein